MYHGTENPSWTYDDGRPLWITSSKDLASMYGENIVEIDTAGMRVLEVGYHARGENIEVPADVMAKVSWLLGDETECDYETLADVVRESHLYDAIDYGHISDTPDGSNSASGRVMVIL